MVMTTNQLGILSGIIAALIWSGFILVSRLGGISELTPYDVIAVRYITCALLVTPIWWLHWRKKRVDIRLIFASLIGGIIYAIFAFQGFSQAPASHAAALLPGLMSFFIIVLAYFVNHERASRQQWLGVFIITLGIGLLLTPLWLSQAFTLGHGYFIAAALCWSLFSVLVKRWNISPWQVTISLAYVTCIVYLPIYWLFLPKAISWSAWESVAIQAVYQGVLASIVQVVFYVKAVQSIGPSSMGALMAMVPFISGISAVFVFDEPATFSLMIGLTLVSGGAWFAHSRLISRRCFGQ